MPPPIVNALSVDVEDYFHPTEVQDYAASTSWDAFEPRIETCTRRILDLLKKHDTLATFFVLGWVADRFPHIVREIVAGGHEIGCHSYHHRLVYEMTPEEFREDTIRAKEAIENAAGVSPTVYRAPSYSIVEKSLWALDILAELGFTHDSSIYPIEHDRYGFPGFERTARVMETSGGSILEVPIATLQLRGKVIPIGGGGYLRMLPYRYTSAGIRRLNLDQGQPACVYFHPWEIDPAQPRLARGLLSRMRTYGGLETMERKIRRLVSEFRFSKISSVFPAELIGALGSHKRRRAEPSRKSIEVCELKKEDVGRWDRYVRQHPTGSPFHLNAWKNSIERTFHYKPHYLMATFGDEVRGVLPLFLVKNLIVGSVLISTPFAVYGGILADSPEARQALYDHAVALGEKLGVEYVEFRNADVSQCVGAPNVSRYVSFSRPVITDEAELMESLPKKTRNLVRKALKQPFVMHAGTDSRAEFERLYSMNMRRLGTPSFPKAHFDHLIEEFGDELDIRQYELNGKVVAVSLNLFFGKSMHTYYAASDPKYNQFVPTVYMYYDHLRWCGQNGYQEFDFGRCKRDTGVYNFKSHWGSEIRELPYEIVLGKRRDLPNFSPTNEKFQTAIKIWRNLPLPVTRAVGPQLIRLFP